MFDVHIMSHIAQQEMRKMSMPSFPDSNKFPTLEQALSAVVASIAMEEMALSHVLNAESEKIKFVLGCAKAKGCDNFNLGELLAVNKSAEDVINSITKLQIILKEKLDTASKFVPPIPDPPIPPPCIPKFTSQPGYVWHKDKALFLMGAGKCHTNNEPCNDGIRLVHRNCESLILLPQGKEYCILLELEAKNKTAHPAKIDVEFFIANEIVRKESISQDKSEDKMIISHPLRYNAPTGGMDSYVAFRLRSPEKLSCVASSISIYLQDLA